MGVEDEIILNTNNSVVATSHMTNCDFDLSIDGYFSAQVPWDRQTFISAISISKTNSLYIRKNWGFCS